MTGTFCHWVIMTRDIARAEKFYTDLFGWNISHEFSEEYLMVDTGKEPGGALSKSDDFATPGGITPYFQVDDCAAFLDKAVSLGGTKILEKTEIPQIGWYCKFGDLDGNAIGLYEDLKK